MTVGVMVAMLASALITPVTANAEEVPVSSPVEAPIVVEALGTSVGPDSVDPDDPELIAELEQVHQDFDEGRTRSVAAPVQSWPSAAAIDSGMTVTFDKTHTAPPNIQALILAVAQEWDEAIVTSPAGPVEIAVIWKDLGPPGLLGSAGPNGFVTIGGSSGPLYPAALANTLLDQDVLPNNAELIVNLNSSSNWHLGPADQLPSDKVDLYSVVLHEMGHGLGFIGSASNGEDQLPPPELQTPPFIFDSAVTHDGQPLLSTSDPNSLLQSNNLFINIGGGALEKLYAPPNWQEGSSFSHFDEEASPSGTSGALMTPSIGSGQAERVLDASVLGVMRGMGWSLRELAAPGRPSPVTVSDAGLTPTISWGPSAGAAVTGYEVDRSQDGVNWQPTGTATGLSMAVSVSEGVHQFRVRATSSSESGSYGYSIPRGHAAGISRPVALDGQISRLYRAYFGRDPDAQGFGHWRGQRADGAALSDISEVFAASNEFAARYGQLDDTQFVELIYHNVLGRAADAEGLSHWVGKLGRGVGRGEVMTGFSESNEYVARTGTVPAPTTAESEVYRLYVAFFLRFPDAAGHAYWSGRRSDGASLETIAGAFASSNEFVSTYGFLGDDAFVNLVYSNVLGRSADSGGLSYWRAQLGSGLDRGAMMIGFSNSTEFIVATGTLP